MNSTGNALLYLKRAALTATFCLCAASAQVAVPQTAATSPPEIPGDAVRGEQLFTTAYRCYACHGYDAQTGERRLQPMRFTQQAFIRFVRNSPLPRMPAYAAVPEQDLADIFAYIRSIPIDAPKIEQTPLLRELRNRKLAAFEQ